MVGLTTEETREFERLDSSAALEGGDHVTPGENGVLATNQKDRWLVLYSKHDKAGHQWMVDSRAAHSDNSPFLN